MEGLKRKRKTCETCGEEFSDRHFRRHKLDPNSCKVSSFDVDVPVHVPSGVEADKTGQTSLSECDQSVNSLKVSEVLETESDICFSSTEDDCFSSDDSDLDEFFSDFQPQEKVTENNECSVYVQWILKVLMLWQSRFFLPGAALSFMLLLIKSILFLCAKSSPVLKNMYNAFPATLYQLRIKQNGILESMPTNKHNIEIQLMRRSLEYMNVSDIPCNTVVMNDLGPEFRKLLKIVEPEKRGSLGQMLCLQNFSLTQMSSRNFRFQSVDWSVDQIREIQYSSSSNTAISDDELRHLTRMYEVLYPNVARSEILVCPSGKLVKHASLCGAKVAAKGGRSYRSSMVLAYWCGHEGTISCYNCLELTPRPGQVQSMLLHTVFLSGKPALHLIMKIKWFAQFEEAIFQKYGKPVEVWRSDIFERAGSAMFMPFQRIKSQFVFAYEKIENKNVLAVMPRDRYVV